MSLGETTSSLFFTCTPLAQDVLIYTTVYTTVLLAAHPTSTWTATYTVTEICTGNPEDYETSEIPPCFVTTTVACDECESGVVEITCPGPTTTSNVVINGDGVTASTTPTSPPHWNDPGDPDCDCDQWDGPNGTATDDGEPTGTGSGSSGRPYATAGASRSAQRKDAWWLATLLFVAPIWRMLGL